ncbi:hypothetical protein QBC44DRAFT_378209 [Cladorrhinum sp. PSN332]|nr:hypothetical protein QBC44DRAFT_378209 [Cladorrhinum sp. PSN332]
MAGIINRYNQSQRSALDKQRAQYKEQIKTLEREIAKSAEDTKHHRARSEAKSKELEELQATSDEKANRIRELECKLEASEIQPRQLSEKFRELEKKLEDSQCKNVLLSDKLHELKTNYNQAITEQQDLYTRSMTHCEDTIKELQEIASAKKAVAERAVQNAEAIREEMLQRVRQDIAEHKAEASDLGRQIETLTQQVQEKDTKLSQQNETIRDLSAKVHDLETSSNGYETLAAQNQEILQRIRDQGFQTHNQSEECAKETWNRLESVSNNLDALAKSFSTQPEMISGIQEAQAKELGSIATKLDFVLETRVSVKETTSQFSTELEAQMGKIWGRLDSQIETLTQQLAQKAEENGILSALCKETQAAYERLEQDIEGLQKASAEQIEEINALQEREQENQLAMEAAREDDQQQTQELVQRLKASEAEAGRLREELKSKIDTMAKLKEQLRAMEEEYGNGLRSFSAEILKLNQALENKDRAAQDAVNRAVEMTAREDKVKMEEALAETQKLLRQRDEHTIALQTQLEELRKSLHDKEQNQRRDACTLSSLREVLSTAESKEKELVEKLTTQSVKADEREAQLRRQMNVVNAELEATKTKVGEYEGEIEGAKRRAEKFEGDSHNQRARVQALFSAVKDWAREGGLETSSLDQICDENKSAQEVGTGISQALAKLGLSQRLQTSHHQRDDLLLDGSESQFNTANREHLVLLSQDSHAFNGPEQSHDVLALINSRRVVVRSPANDPATPIPPSVSEEKARRREGLKPKSIMKTNTVARVTRSVSLMAQGADAESADGDGAQHDSRNEHLMASSPDPLVTNATETPTLPASNPHPPMVGRAQQAGQNKRKQPDEPGPDFFVSRSRKPRTSQMSEDIKTETLAQLEELVGPKRRSAKKRSVRTYGSQRPAESPPEDGSPFNALSTLHSESHAQSRYLTQQHQSPGSNKPRESQESSKTSEDSSETVGAHNEIVLEGGGSSTRLPPLRRNVRRRS